MAFAEYRIVFEGCGAEAVTSPLMERTTTDGVERVRGLIRDGISIEEEVDVGRAEVESAGMSVSVVDRQTDDFWTTHFSRQATTRTWLTADVDSTTNPVTIDVDSSAGFVVDDYLHIGTECMKVTAVPDGISLTCSRAHRGTILQAHYTDSGENLTRPVVAHTYPYGLQGRRARIYEYDLSEHDLQGDGQLIWRGVIATEAELAESGCEWSIMIESLYWLFKQDVGGDSEASFSLRGYFYSAIHPLRIRVYEYSGAEFEFFEHLVSGHFETVHDLVAEINATIPAAISGLTDSFVSGSLTALAFDDGSWGFSLETDGGETKIVGVYVFEFLADFDLASSSTYGTLGTSQIHVLTFARHMRAPRGVWGPHGGTPLVPLGDLDSVNFPRVIHPSGLTLLNVGDTLVLESDGDEAVSYQVSREFDSERRYHIIGPVRDNPWFTPETAPRFTRHITYVRGGTLADFRDALVVNGPIDANRGSAPFLTTEDLAPWTFSVTRGARTAGPIAQRHFIVAQASKLDEMISMECRLLGIFPRLNADGRIGMKYLELPSSSTPEEFVLDDSNIIIDEAPPSWRPHKFGTLNTVKLLTGYDPKEDEHTGPSFTHRDVTSLSIRKKTQELLVEPKSMDAADFTAAQVVNAFRRVLSIYSRPYAIIPVQVPYTLRDVAFVGSVCSITSHRLPNVNTGRRGIVGVKAMVVGRSWNAATGRVDLQLLASNQQFLGYAPSVSISGNVDNGSDNFTLTVSSMDPTGTFDMFPDNLSMIDAFPVGTAIEVMQWDNYTQTPQRGTVTAVSSTEIDVTFVSAPTLTGTRYVRYAAASAVTLTSQESWAYMGTTASFVEFDGGDETASEFAA